MIYNITSQLIIKFILTDSLINLHELQPTFILKGIKND